MMLRYIINARTMDWTEKILHNPINMEIHDVRNPRSIPLFAIKTES
jgi:hypothetical protein